MDIEAGLRRPLASMMPCLTASGLGSASGTRGQDHVRPGSPVAVLALKRTDRTGTRGAPGRFR